MAQKTSFVSPGIYSIETDLSHIPQAATQIGGAIIGLTQKGPAFLPVPVGSQSSFTARFGQTDKELYATYAANAYLANAPVLTVVRVLGKGNPANGFNVDLGRAFDLAFPASGGLNNTGVTGAVFLNSLSAIETVGILRSRQTSGVDIVSNVSYTGTVESFDLSVDGTVYTNLSLDNTKKNYIKNILGTDAKTAHSGDSASGVYIDSVWDYRVSGYQGSYTGSAYGSINNAASASVSGMRYVVGGYKTAKTPMIVSQPYVSGTAAVTYDLFQLESRTDGEASNTDCKISITDVETETAGPKIAPKFTVQVRAFDDIDSRPQVLESFRCDLDPESNFYIERVIGNRYQSTIIPGPGLTPETVFLPAEHYPNKSQFIRVDIATGYKFDSRPAGFRGPKTINPFVATLPNGQFAYQNDIPLQSTHLNEDGYKSNKVYLGFDFEGSNAIGFEDRLKGSVCAVDGAVGSRGFMVLTTTSESTFWTPSLSAYYNNTLTSQFTLVDVSVTGSQSIIQGQANFTMPLVGGHDGIPPSISYTKAINDGTLSAEFLSALATLANPDEIDINLLCVPGIHMGAALYNGNFVQAAISMCEDRGDCFYIADLGKALDPTATNITTDAQDTSVDEATQSVAGLDSNYVAVYYPWVRIYDNRENRLVYVPPSVEAFGAYAYNDRVAQPWFAIGGFTRGKLNSVLEVRKRLTQDQRDSLYEGRVNPIAFYVNQGIIINGQKTLQLDDTALNRVNVRRLLIYIKKVVAGIARLSLFEFNDEKGRQRLYDALAPIFQRIQTDQGLNRFQLIIDRTNNTDDVINRNELRGTIIIEPTKVAEIIIFNYVITPSGAVFTEIQQSLNQ